jgi:hypothetical protein
MFLRLTIQDTRQNKQSDVQFKYRHIAVYSSYFSEANPEADERLVFLTDSEGS